MFVNAAICDDDYQPTQKPILVQFVHADECNEPTFDGCEEDTDMSSKCVAAAAESPTSVAPEVCPKPRINSTKKKVKPADQHINQSLRLTITCVFRAEKRNGSLLCG